VKRFCWIPVSLHITCEKLDMNHGSQSEMIHLESPNQGARWVRYIFATSGLSISFVHGMNFAALKHPWSMIVRILL
jgi:hypothetical protein